MEKKCAKKKMRNIKQQALSAVTVDDKNNNKVPSRGTTPRPPSESRSGKPNCAERTPTQVYAGHVKRPPRSVKWGRTRGKGAMM